LSKLKKIRKWIISDTINGILLFTPNKILQRGPDFAAVVALITVSLVWGTTWVASKQAVMHIPPLQMAGIRQILGGSLYLGYFIYKKYPMPSRQDFAPLIVLALLNFVLSNGLSTWGIKYISAGLGSIIGAIFPLWIVMISFFSDKIYPPKKAVAGLLIGFIGVCVIFYDYLADFVNPDFRFGIFLSLLATWSWAFGTIYTKKHATVFNPYFGIGFQMVLSGCILSSIAYVSPGYTPLFEIPQMTWLAILYLVVFGSLIGFVCYLYALQHLPAAQASIYAYINPIIALITGWLILDESLNFVILLGCVVTLSGIYLVNTSFRARNEQLT